MNTKSYDPAYYMCGGMGTDAAGNRTHAKGCKKQRPLRSDPSAHRAYSIECSNTFNSDRQKGLIRCVPTEGKYYR